MSHLLDDQLYDLAAKVRNNDPFSKEDVANMRHIAQCDDCYQALCCMMAMQDVSMHLGEYAFAPSTSKISAVIRLAIRKVRPLLEQVEAGMGTWRFGAPLPISGTRSKKAAGNVQKLEDTENGQTFVAYDPERKLLVIQLHCSEDDQQPSVQLQLPDGNLREVPLTQQGEYLFGEVRDLDEGDYQIILSK